MIELRLLGGFDVGGPQREQTRSLLAQPRRAALLAFLAVAEPNGLQRRDRIVQMFWPDADPSAGRQSLRQALAFLRKALGDDAFVTNDQIRGEEEVGLDKVVVRCDVDMVVRLLDSGELARAAEIYRGDFLDGFPDTALYPFEQWREEVADELRTRMRAALRELAADASAAGNTELAAHWARRELALNPVDEPTMLHVLRTLAAAGSVQEALEAYDSFVRVLAQDFDETPSEEIQSFADQLRSRVVTIAPPLIIAPPVEKPPAVTLHQPQRKSWGLIGGIIAGVALLLLVVQLVRTREQQGRDTLAVQPFRVSSADPSLAYLRQGLPEMIGARVEGNEGWQLARSAKHAAHVLTGTVVGTPARVSIEVTLRNASNDEVLLTTSVNGPADSVPLLVDRLAALLLFDRVGYRATAPDALLRRPLPMLREFLQGQWELRQGRYGAAQSSFAEVLAADPEFVQAALGLGAAGRKTGEWGPWQTGLRAAWQRRDQLGRADSLYLLALAGPRFPHASTHAEVLDAWERLCEQMPEFGIGWYELGAHLLAWGPVLGINDSALRARAALTRALELDSLLLEPVLPLIEIAADRGDTAAVRTLYDRYVRTGIIGESKDYLDWRVAHFLGDRAAMTRARRALDTLPYRSLLHIIGMAQVDGVGMADAAHAVELLRTRGGRRLDDWHTQTALAQWTINRGAPAEATRLLLASSPVQTGALRDLILFGMYAGGDSSAAARAAGELAARTHAGHPLAVDQANNLCVLTQWRLWRSEPVDAQAVVTSLRAMQRTEMSNCATLIAAIDGVRNRRRNGRGLLEALDREQIAGERPANDAYYGNIAAARLWEQSGDLPRALAAARRRPHNHWEGPWFLRSFLETEVRLAKQNGDRTGAARAASHLERLASRSTP